MNPVEHFPVGSRSRGDDSRSNSDVELGRRGGKSGREKSEKVFIVGVLVRDCLKIVYLEIKCQTRNLHCVNQVLLSTISPLKFQSSKILTDRWSRVMTVFHDHFNDFEDSHHLVLP